ncbi:2-amino-4-hydroxy-6-hydroxymethyldihydropteridine diphosphokinase [Flavobacterium silvaticum]|uniref:2-amino-4-hydroxy-6-hydroxymethyldihydropteridine pyrophosphokinase n=1 Tax=Flavobacterium silvaticum TaxID=1852020 RepID=A0A972FLK5_9FLAO|nr:2-amino-4-hydroxy-6-hydroxymethyldihydropteridine diphosphokinase [Flavobacterium silvaticum]NMH27475.1 2-amino-4-hydroxy-6-hydroxymethyldihydropteridine diphosphokinase [Flavobacterium silvaticum]
MELQHEVILAIGSNEGNRLEQVSDAIFALHQKVGTVIRLSKLYESESWGFSSEPFYNCAVLIHSFFEAEHILDLILSIEEKAGRKRSGEPGYTARTLDIDMITFDSEIIQNERLTIPHPLMQERKFVLLPMRDLQTMWHHPITGRTVAEMIAETSDASDCHPIGNLPKPLANIRLDRLNHIAIEGNIGAGKTTLAKRIAEDFNAKVVLERFADNPFLPKFYEDQNRYAFPLEMSFLADRFQQVSDDLSQFDLFRDFIIADYHLFKSLIFAKVTLAEEEFRLYRKLFDIIYREVPKPDLYVFLYQDTPRLLENIRKRGRSYEQQIPADYLEKINKGYLDYIRNNSDTNVLLIDITHRDFVNHQEDYIFILEEINSKIAALNA